MSNYAWVTLATNDSYSLGALVVAHSLKRVHTAHQLAVLITPGVSEAMKNKLRTIFNVVEEVNLLDSKDDANLALLKRPELGITFTKLHCWRLTQFEKCVFLDADTLVLRNSDELFEREELSAAPDIGWPDCFNSGVYVYRPSLDTFSSLMQYAVTHGSFDGGDQGLLNAYFSDWAHKDISKHLPFIYNTSSVASYSYLPAFKQFGQNTKILHFIGTAKPWLQNFDSESRKVYIPGGYQHLANFLQYWWDVFCEDVHSRLSADMSGLAGALSQLHLGEPKSVEQEVYEEHMRRQCWESGNIDYMGRDSFENIWRRITQTVSAGPSPIAAELGPSTAPVPPRAISPAPPRRRRSSKSRSRSNTPKRDPRDRSPTPQPEDNVPVEKKEVQIEAPIQEEDDNFNVGSLDGSPERSELPPPVQYDPMTSTTTLTKKVFAGYQQVITTKSQEGKTRTHVKTVYDPSVEDASAGYDAADSPKQVTSATVAESRIEPAMPLVVESNKQATPAPPTPKTSPLPAPVPESEHKSTPPRASPRPQLEQQVAQETMAGKQPSVEPIKTSRRKRLSSPQLTSPTITATQTTSSSKLKPQSKSTLALKTASAIKTTTDPSTPTTPKATAQEPTKTKPATASSSSSKSQSLPSSPSSASTPPSPQSPTPSSTNGRPKPTKKKTIDEIETAPLTANDELDNSSAPATPPVPPRRKRESKVSRIVQILTSTVGNVTSYCYQSVKNVVRTVFNVTVDALLVFSLLVVCYSLATFTAAIES
ncbi:mucin-2 isoform X13 [Armigeres subalbatus]|uniref:mucin-2 isoform X13 n=1 Tax=Armigeres subalbatus TaxID=124917 RepID=UPI002ED5EA43